MLCRCCIKMMKLDNIKPNLNFKFTNDQLCRIEDKMFRRLGVSFTVGQIKNKLNKMRDHYGLYIRSRQESWDVKKWQQVKDRSIEVRMMKEGQKLPNLELLDIMFGYGSEQKMQQKETPDQVSILKKENKILKESEQRAWDEYRVLLERLHDLLSPALPLAVPLFE
ncbi:unnamed protein product [Urochloa humidicola]